MKTPPKIVSYYHELYYVHIYAYRQNQCPGTNYRANQNEIYYLIPGLERTVTYICTDVLYMIGQTNYNNFEQSSEPRIFGDGIFN